MDVLGGAVVRMIEEAGYLLVVIHQRVVTMA
jgi:hypothetical protein